LKALDHLQTTIENIHIKEHQDKTFESDSYKEVFHLCETSSGTK